LGAFGYATILEFRGHHVEAVADRRAGIAVQARKRVHWPRASQPLNIAIGRNGKNSAAVRAVDGIGLTQEQPALPAGEAHFGWPDIV